MLFAGMASSTKSENSENWLIIVCRRSVGVKVVKIRCSWSGEGAALGWCLLGWAALVTLNCFLHVPAEELTIVGLVVLMLGNQEIGEKTESSANANSRLEIGGNDECRE
jgi:hypothetical protein